ncbi:hypothetical protein L208DRAFT_1380995 [Tricholoma matsutake]|nr:hypothetical protein L208DRAFT_1380995 [Tricholoma matsutake 945]
MTCWVAQTHQNYVSVMPYNWTATTIHSFQGMRQPAIWMGESGPIIVFPGVNSGFQERGMRMKKEIEVITHSYYSIMLEDGVDGKVLVEQSATPIPTFKKFVAPTMSGRTEDSIIMPTSTLPHVKNFWGYYCTRFDYEPMYQSITQPKFPMYGVVQNTTIHPGMLDGSGKLLSGYALFSANTTGQIICSTWAEKLGCFALEGATEVQKDIFWMGITHALQYPSEQHEEGSYYSGYDGKIHKANGGESYTRYSIWYIIVFFCVS